MYYPNKIYVKDYFDIHNFYSNIYGYDRTIILMQVGQFYEVYSMRDGNVQEFSSKENGLNLINLGQEIDARCTKKNGSLPLSKSNPRMIGFPIQVTFNYVDKLIDLQYTIVMISQVTEPPNPERAVTGIYSPGTYIEKKNINTLYLVSIVLDKIKDKNGLYQLCAGLTAYDLTTGEGSVHETYTNNNDVLEGLDDMIRFFENYPPKEIILYNNIKDDDIIATMNINDIFKYLSININEVYIFKINNHKKINWQNDLLERIYKINNNINIIDTLGLEFLNWARLSLVILLDYVFYHQSLLLDHIQLPKLFSSNKYLYLGNRALEQLNVNTKEMSLFSVINNTKTNLGKKFLNNQLVMPLIDVYEINKRYELIESFINNNYSNKIISYLEDIYDLDKLIRKLEINIINPSELYYIYLSFIQIDKLYNFLKNSNLDDKFEIIYDNSSDIYNWINNKFILDKIMDINLNNFMESDYSFYNANIHGDIDELIDKINSSNNFINLLIKVLEGYIDDKNYMKKGDDKNLITFKYNDREGHYLLLTKRRSDLLIKKLENIKEIKVGSFILTISDLEFNDLPKSANTKINCKKIKEISLELINYKLQLAKKLKEHFKEDMKIFSELYKELLHFWSNKIAYIDFINSGAISAINNHYSKPIIKIKNSSYFKSKELRHPIIEKINNKTCYIPHNIELGTDTEQNGILLYGINSSGKSTLMKSIGLNIILAQIGYYTASTYFEYSPYNSLFTRINSNDNMYKGQSSFMVEMMELMAILKRNNQNTLIIGDEICKGTEEKSANIIVCYMLEILSKSNSSFITATHLHNIASMNSVKQLNNLKVKHLKLTYDTNNDILIYDRNLLDGQGESFYGLQVAKYIMKDNLFNQRTQEIMNEYDNVNKKSKYNKDVYMYKCEICNCQEKLETHHIIWQKDFVNNINNSKFYLQKNDPCNLVTLCSKCHDKVDNNQIIINGWINTSQGKKFDYTINENVEKKSKYSYDIIEFIKNIKSRSNNDPKMARIIIKDELDIRISTNTILSYWL